MPRECPGHSKHPLPTTQETTLHMDITRWSIPKSDWLYSLQPKMENLYTISKNRLRHYCGSDHELLTGKFRLKVKKGKTTWPFRYDLNQVPDIIQWKWQIDPRGYIWWTECLKYYGWRLVTLYRRQWSRPSSRKRQSSCLRRLYK